VSQARPVQLQPSCCTITLNLDLSDIDRGWHHVPALQPLTGMQPARALT
jgi:hypothetical protein